MATFPKPPVMSMARYTTPNPPSPMVSQNFQRPLPSATKTSGNLRRSSLILLPQLNPGARLASWASASGNAIVTMVCSRVFAVRSSESDPGAILNGTSNSAPCSSARTRHSVSNRSPGSSRTPVPFVEQSWTHNSSPSSSLGSSRSMSSRCVPDTFGELTTRSLDGNRPMVKDLPRCILCRVKARLSQAMSTVLLARQDLFGRLATSGDSVSEPFSGT
mmetsp:Transcript_14542/g.39924  ORF Transcript_14542/g.39924 Transcript_14542/m.39924 type:complete len:218 (-) Transcript_14542:163-816(-)